MRAVHRHFLILEIERPHQSQHTVPHQQEPDESRDTLYRRELKANVAMRLVSVLDHVLDRMQIT